MACRIDETRKDKYCIAPFLSPAITPTGFKMCSAPCAKSFPTVDFWNGEYMKKIRKEWIDGIVPDDCEDCYLNADGLIGSDALPTNSVTVPLNFDNLYLARSNRCDLACEMCSADISHTWDKVHNGGKLGIVDNDFDLMPYLPNTRHIAISGGNPVLDHKINDIINALDNEKVERFLITSNGSVFPDRMLNNIINKKLKCEVLLIFSIDGPKEFNEKARLGTKQEKVYNTIFKVMQKTSNIKNLTTCIEFTGTNKSIKHLIPFYEEIKRSLPLTDQGPHMIGNKCSFPEHLGLQNTDEETWEHLQGETYRYFIKRKDKCRLAAQFFQMVNEYCAIIDKARKRKIKYNANISPKSTSGEDRP